MRSSVSASGKKRPEWNSLQTDLGVHKLTLEEMERRRASRRSKNLDAARNDLYSRLRNEQTRLRRHADSERTKLRGALQRGTQLEQREVHDLLARTDRQLALIADLIGERGKKHRGVPNVTTAPNGGSPSHQSDDEADSSWLPRQAREVESQLDLLSNSVMNVTALNDDTNLSAQRSVPRKKQPAKPASKASAKQPVVVVRTESGPESGAENASPERAVAPKQKSAAATQWFVPLETANANASPKRELRKSPNKCATPRSAQRSARSASASPSARTRSPLKSPRVAQAQVDCEARTLSARLRSLNDRAKVDRIVQLWTAGEQRAGEANGVDQLDVLCEVCITVRQLQQSLHTERLIRERTESVAGEQRELIDALTGELIETQQRLASLEGDFTELHREIVTKFGLLQPPTLKQYESRRYDTPAEESFTADRSDWLSSRAEPQVALNSGASVLKEVDRLKEQYRAIQSKLNTALQRSAHTLRTYGAASPTRLSNEDRPNAAASDNQSNSNSCPAPVVFDSNRDQTAVQSDANESPDNV